MIKIVNNQTSKKILAFFSNISIKKMILDIIISFKNILFLDNIFRIFRGSFSLRKSAKQSNYKWAFLNW